MSTRQGTDGVLTAQVAAEVTLRRVFLSDPVIQNWRGAHSWAQHFIPIMDLAQPSPSSSRWPDDPRLSPGNDRRSGTEPRQHPSSPPKFDCEKILKALSDAKRQRVVRALLAGPQTVGDLGKSLEMEQYNISKILGILRTAGIVEFTQAGSVRTYRIAKVFLSSAGTEKNVLEFGCCRFRFDRLPV